MLAKPFSILLTMSENSQSSLCPNEEPAARPQEISALLRNLTCDAACSSSSLDSEEVLWAGWIPPGFCGVPAGGAEFIPLKPPLLPGAELTVPAQVTATKKPLPPKKGECCAKLKRRDPHFNHYVKVAPPTG